MTTLANELIGVPPPLAVEHPESAPTTASRLDGPLLIAGMDPAALDGALHLAQLLARRDRVNAHVLGIVPPLPPLPSLLSPREREALDEGRRQTHHSVLRRHVHRTIGRPVLFSTGAEIGRTVDTIGRTARTRRSALVLVGLEPKGSPQRTATEQLALRAAAATNRPVLAVPTDATLLPRRALIAMDFGPASTRAAQAAATIVGPTGIVTPAHIESGMDPVTALLHFASSNQYDLIAVGSHSGPRSEFRLAGSVCRDLLAGANGAVLIVPPPEVEDDEQP